jgi:hypothetical protein
VASRAGPREPGLDLAHIGRTQLAAQTKWATAVPINAHSVLAETGEVARIGLLISWKFARNLLMRHVRFSPQLGEKAQLNQCAGTIFDSAIRRFESSRPSQAVRGVATTVLRRNRAFDNRHRITNPGFMGHMQHRLLINE